MDFPAGFLQALEDKVESETQPENPFQQAHSTHFRRVTTDRPSRSSKRQKTSNPVTSDTDTVLSPIQKPLSLYDHHFFPDVSPADHYCFMCSEKPRFKQNPLWLQLQNILDGLGDGTIEQVCSLAKEFYDEQFRPHILGQPEWTVNSILKHLFEHRGVSEYGRMKEIQRMYFMMLRILAQTGLKVYDVEQQQEMLNEKGVRLFMDLSDRYTRCSMTLLNKHFNR